jgi:hypothetical protein
MKRLSVFSIQLRHLTATNHSAEMGSSSNRLTSHTLPLEPDASKLNANGSWPISKQRHRSARDPHHSV